MLSRNPPLLLLNPHLPEPLPTVPAPGSPKHPLELLLPRNPRILGNLTLTEHRPSPQVPPVSPGTLAPREPLRPGSPTPTEHPPSPGAPSIPWNHRAPPLLQSRPQEAQRP